MSKVGTVLVSGHFNILHPGHLRLFRAAKEYGERLVVAVKSDRLAGLAAHLPEHLRLDGVLSNGLVDEAFIYDENISDLIARIRPDVVVKGKEYELIFNPEFASLQIYGGLLVFSSGETIFSSLDLIRKEFQNFELRSISLPVEYFSRHSIIKDNLIEFVEKFSNLRICVVGDLIVDEYISCEPLGMSQEDPTIVVMPVDTVQFLGGAGIVAAHAAGLGGQVNFFSVTGSDVAREYALSKFVEFGVACHLLVDQSRPTTLKQRYRSKGKTLLRVSHLHQGAISGALQKKLLGAIELVLGDTDLLVFSDFNYGCLPQSFVQQLVEMAKSHGVFLAADSQSSSQMGDISRFKGMDLITPTEREARISTRNREDGLVVLAEQLRQQAAASNVLLKLGEDGVLIHAGDGKSPGWLTDRIVALNSSPKDVAGAGDSLLIVSAMVLASGGSIWEAAVLGSLAAAVQVGRLGNTPLRSVELLGELA